MLNMQNVKDIEITEGKVRTIHDKDSRLIWGRLAYDTKYAGDTVQSGTPTPDAPIPVQTVTGEQTVEVHGKNLFHIENSSTSIYVWNGSSVTVNATSSSSYINITGVNPMGSTTFPAGTYTLSTSVATGDYTKVFRLRWGGENHDQTISKNSLSVTFTATEEFTIKQIFVSGISSGTTINDTFGFQIEEGSTATSYQPYQSQSYHISLGSIELCKINDYQDYIYKSGDDWYVHKECGKVVFNGSENWQKNDANVVFTLADAIDYMRDGTAPVSDNFLGQSEVTSFARMEDNRIGFLQSAANNRTIIKYTTIASASAFKTWLSSHNTTVYYPLATTTDTKITDATLIGQLNAVHEWLTRYGYASTVTGNLPIIIDRTNL